jgi:hypothetical protein
MLLFKKSRSFAFNAGKNHLLTAQAKNAVTTSNSKASFLSAIQAARDLYSINRRD